MIQLVLLFSCLIQLNQGLYENYSFINDLDSINLKIEEKHLASETCLVLRKGKKNYCLVKFN